VRLHVAALLIFALMACAATVAAQEWGTDPRTGQPATFATGAFGAERFSKSPQITVGAPQPVLIVDPRAPADDSGILQASAFSPNSRPVMRPAAASDNSIFEAPAAGAYSSPTPYSTIETPMLPTGGYGQECYECGNDPWQWTLLPKDLIWHSYLAGPKEPRFGGVLFSQTGGDTYLDGTLGARVGILRYGSPNSVDFLPQGWQLDVEGDAIIRQDLSQDSDVHAYDFRIGVPISYGIGRYQMKMAWYHTSAHLGDEFSIKNPTFPRINFSRNAIVWGHSYFLTDDLRIYGEIDYGYWTDGGSEPWLFQTGFEYSPLVRGARGAPFLAVNGLLEQENDFGGPFTLQTGWQWRPLHGGQRLRIGFHYQTGPTPYGEFYRFSEEQIGAGIWYDF
jgi:hypothetical protein